MKKFEGKLVTLKQYRNLRLNHFYGPKKKELARHPKKREYFGLGRVPIGIGAVLNGWHGGPQSVLDFRAMTNACPHDCFHCFTDKNKKTLKLEEIKGVIDQAADFGFKGIDYLGEGEPTLDKDFFEILHYTSLKGIVPIVFTDAATKLRDMNFLSNLIDTGASICPKCDSLFNEEYQNWVVGDKTKTYFQKRNDVVWGLEKQAFNGIREGGRTKMGFDMIVTKRNIGEVEKTLRMCRERNWWIIFSTYLPAGRCANKSFDNSLAPSSTELTKMRETIKRVDSEYGFEHPIYNNFGTFPCVEFMQIYGDGRVSLCPGNETIVGNVRKDSLKNLAEKIRNDFPCHQIQNINGNCPYRP